VAPGEKPRQRSGELLLPPQRDVATNSLTVVAGQPGAAAVRKQIRVAPVDRAHRDHIPLPSELFWLAAFEVEELGESECWC
jgi:hypothetical protein